MASTPSRIRYNPDGTRQGQLLSLNGLSTRTSSSGGGDDDNDELLPIIEIDESIIYVQIASFLAWKHVQERSPAAIPSLPQRLATCDFYWSLDARDTQFSPLQGIREFVDAITDPQVEYHEPQQQQQQQQNDYDYLQSDLMDINQWQFPFAISGATYSSITLPLSILGSAYELPQTSGSATSAALDAQPMFGRTIPTNDADAKALMLYMKHLGVTHMATLFIKDPWGTCYFADLQKHGNALGITVVGFSYVESDIVSSIQRLKQSGMHYIYAIFLSEWKRVMEAAYDAGIIGHNRDFVWIAAEMIDWTERDLEFDRTNPRDLKLAQALQGVGSLVLHVEPSDFFLNAMMDFAHNKELQQEFINTHPESFIFDNFTFPEPTVNFQHYMFYDATYSMAVAACETPGLFTGPELYQKLINLEFEGVTGNVRFDNTTGTRSPESVIYRIDNVYWSDERSDDNFIRFDSQLAVTVSNGQVDDKGVWRYYDNTTIPPPAIPPFEHNYNLIPLWAQILGWVLGGIVVMMSSGWIFWTWYHRKRYIVRASQPIFLCQLCAGTFIMGLAVIPMSMQGNESSSRLDMACLAIPWLVLVGFVVAFSALFSKTWRLNKLLKSGSGMRRIAVQAKDVIWPFIILISLNVTMLLCWSLVSPSSYVRIEDSNYDSYGRSLESYGRCESEGSKHFYFLIPLLVFDFIGVATATYQSYVARDLPTELSESSYLGMSMASLLETLFLGGPILLVVSGNPTMFYLVGSALLCICVMTILLPVFVPKYKLRQHEPSGRAAIESVMASVQSFRNNPLRVSNGQEPRSNEQSNSWGKMRVNRR